MKARLILWTGRRDWRTRELRVVLAALVVAVATVSTIALFASHLRQAILGSASQFLAADRQVSDARPLPDDWYAKADELGLRQSRLAEFSTMLFAGESLQLANVKAVDASYPLAGQIEMQVAPDAARQVRGQGPSQGAIWVNVRLLQLLAVQPGDEVEIGRARFTIDGILLREPDAGFSLGNLAPRVMMNLADVPATGVMQPGSRVNWVGLFSGSDTALMAYEEWLKPRLQPGHRWRGVREGRPAIGGALDKAERFLLLGGSLAVLLAAVAVAVASRQYALHQQDSVALLKTLGMSSGSIGRLYLLRLLILGVAGLLLGLLCGVPVFLLFAWLAEQVLAESIPLHVDFSALWLATATAMIAMLAFAWPALSRVTSVPAMRVLRAAPGSFGRIPWRELLAAGAGLLLLLWLYSRDWGLTLALLGGVLTLLLILGSLGGLILRLLESSGRGQGRWRMAIAALHRHRHASLGQMAVFALVSLLAGTLILIRTSLLEDWRHQLPADAPNHFLVNIAPDDLGRVETFLRQQGVPASAAYPMVRGRLTTINGQPVRQVVSKDEDIGALNRELNLTWTDDLPDDNRIEAGQWGLAGQRDGVSVEKELADKLGIGVGDKLGFVIGDRPLETQVSSLRRVQWDSMRPNFYVIFAAGGLDGLPATWINSFHLDASRKQVLNEFSRAFPTVSIMEVDHFIDRIRLVVNQVSQAIEAILVLILLAAILVMAAVVSATLRERRREGALLRTLGFDRKRMVQVTLMEFGLLGLVAGLLGVFCAEGVVWALQYRVFEGEFRLHPLLWLLMPLSSAVLLALLGRWQLRPVLSVSPMLLLRELE